MTAREFFKQEYSDDNDMSHHPPSESRIADIMEEYAKHYHEQQLRSTLLEFHKAIIPDDVADKIPYTREEIVGAFIISQQ